MGRQVLLVVLYWLAISESSVKADKPAKSSIIKDNVSEESAPRLYQNVPLGVYASAVPYPAVSYRYTSLPAGLVQAASRVIPVKEELVLHNAKGYLRDSYGNRFVGTPFSGAYKTSIPQQYVQLQELPAHLTKPIAVAPNYQAKLLGPQIKLGPQFIPTFRAASPTPLNHFYGSSYPVAYAQNIKSLAPTSFQQVHSHSQQLQSPQQQSSSNQAVYADTHSAEKYSQYKNEPKFQRLQEKPTITYDNEPKVNTNGVKQEILHEQSQIKASPDTQTYTTIVNGKKTVVQVETNPPLPLLDLTLLEPLKFDNPSPVVPQIAQFLPKINQATYKKLPEFHKQQKSNSGNKIQGDVEIIKGRSKAKPKKKPKKPVVHNNDVPHVRVPVEPSITFKGKPNESPEFSYEINAPNYKETYKEQTLKYNKETSKDPVSYSYNHKEEKDPVNYSYGSVVQKEPVTYSVVHHSNGPGHKEVHHHTNEPPKQLIYTFKPEDQRDDVEHNAGPVHQHSPQSESGESSSAEEADDGGYPQQHPQYHERPSEPLRPHDNRGYHDRPAHHESEYKQRPLEVEHRQRPYNEYHNERPSSQEERPHHAEHAPRQHDRPSLSYQQPIPVPVQYEQELQPITTHEYEEELRLLPSPSPASIKVDPNQHVIREEQHQRPRPSPHPYSSNENHEEYNNHQRHPNHREHQESYGPTPVPVIHEKGKRIIIEQESPDERHSHKEQMVAEMLEHEENNEEDFENAYKNAAFGFPAFHRKQEDVEKHIYNPDSYGESHNQGFTFDERPFEQYQAEGDDFPKSARLKYKDANENTKEDYFLDYAVNKPTSLRDRHKKKQEYFKLYESFKPENYFGGENKEKEKEKYTIAPSFVYVNDPEPKKTSYFAQYKAAPPKFSYTFKKQNPRDNSAFASRPFQSFTRKTNFVEPQFQYGFEPIALPRLLDSELAAMASNDSPESEKPALRKKIYKENWYIKKTSTAGGDAS
ncbi:uncharacterized protein LOC128675288 [Plodia interpunctella]|uniref:uncharacterized protein LOC128675288 n=1 Tax=Plodia interpunctella TaxID=58824 RepID=UPI002367F35F|nr:uncharacterized protein LOC128675288 [Plodia interpunctella]